MLRHSACLFYEFLIHPFSHCVTKIPYTFFFFFWRKHITRIWFSTSFWVRGTRTCTLLFISRNSVFLLSWVRRRRWFIKANNLYCKYSSKPKIAAILSACHAHTCTVCPKTLLQLRQKLWVFLLDLFVVFRNRLIFVINRKPKTLYSSDPLEIF